MQRVLISWGNFVYVLERDGARVILKFKGCRSIMIVKLIDNEIYAGSTKDNETFAEPYPELWKGKR